MHHECDIPLDQLSFLPIRVLSRGTHSANPCQVTKFSRNRTAPKVSANSCYCNLTLDPTHIDLGSALWWWMIHRKRINQRRRKEIKWFENYYFIDHFLDFFARYLHRVCKTALSHDMYFTHISKSHILFYPIVFMTVNIPRTMLRKAFEYSSNILVDLPV